MYFGIPKKYIDKWGMIVNLPQKDGGDSCQRMGLLALYAKLTQTPNQFENFREFFRLIILKLMPSSRRILFRRHPDPSKWYSRVNTFSRDQATTWVMALAVTGYTRTLFSFMVKHFLRFGFMWNTRRNWQYPTLEEHEAAKKRGDIGAGVAWDYSWKLPDWCGPEFFGLYIRGFRFYPFYPLLLLADLETFINGIIKFIKKEDNDIINHTAVVLFGNYSMPTPLIWLAGKLLKKSDYERRLDKYFSGGDPQRMSDMFKPLIGEL